MLRNFVAGTARRLIDRSIGRSQSPTPRLWTAWTFHHCSWQLPPPLHRSYGLQPPCLTAQAQLRQSFLSKLERWRPGHTPSRISRAAPRRTYPRSRRRGQPAHSKGTIASRRLMPPSLRWGILSGLRRIATHGGCTGTGAHSQCSRTGGWTVQWRPQTCLGKSSMTTPETVRAIPHLARETS